eukprot:TRINITY_DN45039_c0_g1_i1.p1 TRINITY_DN45039_c0_g1~~TRINITY_DN45039_c0_g1_i1.p1  ORF type:complete len:199 (-),score=22.56 TRINITY_DN45039_c0_g1_i1:100-696(-)
MAEPIFTPVFVQHPDGSIVHGVPLGYKEPEPPDTPRRRVAGIDLNTLNNDIIKVLAKHEAIFIGLLLLELGVVIFFEILEWEHKKDALEELSLLYPSLAKGGLETLYWMAFIGEVLFEVAFFGLGMAAAFLSKPRLYYRFSTVAIIGTLGQLPLAYLNRFNLLVFFLRFIAYAYSRFQWNLLRSIDLMRDESLNPSSA